MDGRSPETRAHAGMITGPSLADVWPEVSGRLGRLLASRGASRDLADDVVQEVAARALARGIVFDDAADLMRWAVPVALNLLVDSARHAGRVTVGIDGWDAAEGDVADLVAHRDRLTRVLGAVERLSDADRVALTSVEAPADRREAVKLAVRRHRARRRLLALVDGVAAFVALAGVWARRTRAPRTATVAALPVAFVLPVALVLVQPVPAPPAERAIAVAAPPRVAVPLSAPAAARAVRVAAPQRPASRGAARAEPARTVAKGVAAPPRTREVVNVGPDDERRLRIRQRNGTNGDHILCIHDPLPVVGSPCVLKSP